jgi:ribonuclease HI
MTMKKKNNFYVVWKGRMPGIYETWEECRKQINEFQDAKFKGFKTKELAEIAFNGHCNDFIGKEKFESELTPEQLVLIGNPILDSIAVDGAWNTSNGLVEYQGVFTRTKERIFKMGPYKDGTHNIVEFLALVHALAYCKKNGLEWPIYSDSRTAISWVRNKKAGTEHLQNEKNNELFILIERAEKWLGNNHFNNKILKWETKAWGEIPADFGRK